MSSFELPLTVRTMAGLTDLVIRLPGPESLGSLLPVILAAAGLPERTQLYAGAAPIDPDWLLGCPPMLAGFLLSTEPDDGPAVVGQLELACVAGPDAGRRVPLEPGDQLIVGRGAYAGLRLDDPALSREHIRFTIGPAGARIADLGSTNGVRVDGKPADSSEVSVPAGALVRVGGSVLRAASTAQRSLMLSPDGAGRLVVARPARLRGPFRHRLPPAAGDPPVRTRRPIPLLAAVIGAGAGVAIALLTGMWTFLWLAALGPVLVVGSAIGDRVGGRRGHRRAVADHRAAMAADDQAIRRAEVADRLDAWDRYPDPATLLRLAESAGHRLWERRPVDPDFLRLTIGVGCRPVRVDRSNAPELPEVPITVSLRRLGVLGMIGDVRALLRFLLVQLAALHAPSDLRIVICSAAADLLRLRDLPHLMVDGGLGDLVRSANDLADLADLADHPGTSTVVVLDGAHAWRRRAPVRRLLRLAATGSDPDLGLTEDDDQRVGTGPIGSDRRPAILAICVDSTVEALPVECTAVATVLGDRMVVATAGARLEAEPIGVAQQYLQRFVRALAPLRDPDESTGSLPARVTLSELDSMLPTEAATRLRWEHPALSTVLGCGRAGPVLLDLERDGPHLLIAGTTGSGKSELLQTLVCGLALAGAPEFTSFLLVDYKGGAAFGALAGLPHITGLVTDLDAEQAGRALTSLRAEVRRRERMLSAAGVVDLAELRSRHPAESFPHLVIVVDEFATLAVEVPEFLIGLVDVAQRGRSLGVHLVLATQRPAGVLSPAVKANMTSRICLRVADDGDSIDVIDAPDAARLPVRVPGRAILRTGRDGTEMFQTARITAPSPADRSVRLRDLPISDAGTGPSDLARILAAVGRAADGRPRPRPAWRPPLPTLLTGQPSHLLGLLDHPETAEQHPVELPGTSVLITGPPGSGRTGGLRRLARGWATNGAEILLVDTGGGLSDLADWPATSTALDGTDPLLMQRLLNRLQGEMGARGGRPGPPILFVLDGLAAPLAALDLLDYGTSTAALSELAGRGPSVGIRVAASEDARVTHHRIAGQFGTRILLSVDQRGEPRIGCPPGRGRIGPDEVQLGYDPPGTPPPDRSPDTAARLVVRPLPLLVPLEDLPVPRPEAVPIGRGGDDGRPALVDLTSAGGWLVAGPRRSGVSTALRALACGAARAGIPVLRTTGRPTAPWPGVGDIPVRAGAAELERRLVDHQGPLLVVVDGLDTDHPAHDLLLRFLAVAGSGQFLIVGVRLDLAVRSHRGVVAEVATHRRGVLLQADAADGSMLDVRLPRRRGPLIPGRGHLVQDGEVAEVQIAVPAHLGRSGLDPAP